jgi:hypothetical protein
MKTLCLVAVLVGAAHLSGCRRSDAQVNHARWTGARFTCPSGTDMWVSESESLAGKDDAAYCIPTKKPAKKQRKVSALMSEKELLDRYEYEDEDNGLNYSSLDDLEAK